MDHLKSIECYHTFEGMVIYKMSVQLFSNGVLDVNLATIVCEDSATYFKARDVAKALGYENPMLAIRMHVWDENKFEYCNIKRGDQNHHHLQPRTILLMEPGVYQLIFKSRLQSAKIFQRWVFSEVLPSIRRTGSYSMNSLCNALSGMTLNVLSNNDRDQLTKYKTILKTHVNMLKDPVAVERGQRGELKSQENRRILVEEARKLRGRIKVLNSLVSGAIDVVNSYE